MSGIKRNVKPFIFCLLSIALSAFCLYVFSSTAFSDTTSHINSVRELYPGADEDAVTGLIRKEPKI